jgi:dolichol-phosphate mannosyltransferase
VDKNILVSVATVLHDDARSVTSYIEEASAVLQGRFQHFELVLIDNGSVDPTVDTVRQTMGKFPHIRLVALSREYDEQVAITAALENSIGDFVVIMDLHTDPPGLVPEMVEKARSGYDIVTAEVAGRKRGPLLYRCLANVFYRVSNLVADYRVDVNASNFVCFSRKMVNSILQIRDRVRYLKYLKTDIGYSQATIPYEQISRCAGRRRKNSWNRIFFAFDTLVSNSGKLMRVATALSLLTSVLSFGYILYALAIKLFKEGVPEGWASTSMVLAFMFGVMFFILFIIGEYISLVYKEARKGPLYHVADEFNSSVLFEQIRERNVIQEWK